MGKIMKNGIEYSASSNSAENISYNGTKNVKEAIDDVNSSLVTDIYVGDDGKLHKVIGGADTVLNFNSAPSFGEETKSITYSRLNGGGDTLTITFSHDIIGIKNISWGGGTLGDYAQPVVNYSISGKTVTISVRRDGDYGTFPNAYTISVTIIYLK